MQKKQNSYLGFLIVSVTATLVCSTVLHYENRPAPSGIESASANTCGDGFIASAETCDDGNTAAGDGCSASCATETNYFCETSCPLNQFVVAPDTIATTVALDSSRVLVAWIENDQEIYARIGTINGSDITYGSTYPIIDDGNYIYELEATLVDTDNVVIAFTMRDLTYTAPYAVALSIDGTTVDSFGTHEKLNVVTADVSGITVDTLSTSKVIVSWVRSSTAWNNAVLVSDINLTGGVTYGFSGDSVASLSKLSVAALDDEYFIVTFFNSTNQGNAYVGYNNTAISEQYLTFGAGSMFDSDMVSNVSITALDASRAFVAYYDTNETDGKAMILERSGLDITLGTSVNFYTDNALEQIHTDSFSANEAVVGFIKSSATPDENQVRTAKTASIAGRTITMNPSVPSHWNSNLTLHDVVTLDSSTMVLGIDDSGDSLVVGDTSQSYCESICYTSFHDQIHYRWRDDSVGKNTDGGWLAAEDTNMSTAMTVDEAYRLRISLANTGQATSVLRRFELQFGEKETTCADISTWNAIDAVDGDDFAVVDSTHFTGQEIANDLLSNPEGYSPALSFVTSDEDLEITTPTCDSPTIYVDNGFIVGGPDDGEAFAGTLNGTAGNDVIQGPIGETVTVNAGDGRDTICTAGQDDTINAGGGNDTIAAGGGSDTIYGGAGNDTIYAEWGLADEIYGEGGNDQIYGGGGADTIQGGDGNDTIYGQDGIDTIYGNDGNDQIYGGDGEDTIDGGDGTNTIDYGDDVIDTFTIVQNAFSELEFTIAPTEFADASDYCFRLYDLTNDATLDQYSLYPEATLGECGDGTTSGIEQCDDSNTVSGDGCSNQCVTEAGWICTDGVCTAAQCGDGIKAGVEQCDPPANGACNEDCTLHTTAGGSSYNPDTQQIRTEEELSNEPPRPQVGAVLCGDGVLDPGEECDFGPLNGDFNCTKQCKKIDLYCGDGIVTELLGEECDPPASTDKVCGSDVCGSYCRYLPACDLIAFEPTAEKRVETETVAFDDPIAESFDIVLDGVCGDGVVNANEECDTGGVCSGGKYHGTIWIDANDAQNCTDGGGIALPASGDGCSDLCYIEQCGDGIVQSGEDCDNGNVCSGDGVTPCFSDFDCRDGSECVYNETNPLCLDTCVYCDGVYEAVVPLAAFDIGVHRVKVLVENECGIGSVREIEFEISDELFPPMQVVPTHTEIEHADIELPRVRSALLPPTVSLTSDRYMYSPADTTMTLQVIATDEFGSPYANLSATNFKISINGLVNQEILFSPRAGASCANDILPEYFCSSHE